MTDFKFTKNTQTKALKEEPLKSSKLVGRPREQKQVRKKHIGCYLTEEESLQLQEKLDGRPASSVVRSLILDYINN